MAPPALSLPGRRTTFSANLVLLSLTVCFFIFRPLNDFPMAATSKVLFIGGTGYIGKFIVEASAKAGYPTYALVRESTLSSPAKASIIEKFKSLGVNLVLVRKNFTQLRSLFLYFALFCKLKIEGCLKENKCINIPT